MKILRFGAILVIIALYYQTVYLMHKPIYFIADMLFIFSLLLLFGGIEIQVKDDEDDKKDTLMKSNNQDKPGYP